MKIGRKLENADFTFANHTDHRNFLARLVAHFESGTLRHTGPSGQNPMRSHNSAFAKDQTINVDKLSMLEIFRLDFKEKFVIDIRRVSAG